MVTSASAEHPRRGLVRRVVPAALVSIVAALGLILVLADHAGDPSGPVASGDGSETTTTVPTTNEVGVDPGGDDSWQPLGEPGVGGRMTALAVDPQNPDRVLVGGDLLGAAVSTDGGTTWERSTGLVGHEVGRYTFHPDSPDEVWVGTMSGPHVSNDGGRTWELRRDGFPTIEEFSYSAPVEVVVVDRADPDRLLAFGGSHRQWESLGDPAWGVVWESTDRGATWSRLAEIADGANVVSAIQLPDGAFLAAALDRGVYRSDDRGSTWQPVGAGLAHGNVRELASGGSTGVVYAALGAGPVENGEHISGGVYRSDDGGLTFESRSEQLGGRRGATPELTSRYDTVVVSNVDPDTVWTADLAFGIEAVYRSADAGRTWTVELGQPRSDDDGSRIDDGTAITSQPAPSDPAVATFYSSPVTAEVLVPKPNSDDLRFIAQSEYVLRRDDQGVWIDATAVPTGGGWAGTGYSGLVATDIAFDPEDPAVLALSALDGGQFLVSNDAGQSWSRPLTSWDNWGGGQAITMTGRADTGQGHTYVWLGQFGMFNGIAASSDGRQTWNFAAGPDVGLPERYQAVDPMGDVAAFPDEPARVVATIGGDVYLSVDAGISWRRTLAGTYGALVIDDDGRLYGADDTGVWELDGDADNPVELAGAPTAVDQLVADGAGGVYAVRWGVADNTDAAMSRWDGSTWQPLCPDPESCGSGFGRYPAALAVDPGDPDHLVVAMNDLPFHDVAHKPGVFESRDAGATWTVIDNGLPITRVSIVAFDPHRSRLIVGTVGGGFYQRGS